MVSCLEIRVETTENGSALFQFPYQNLCTLCTVSSYVSIAHNFSASFVTELQLLNEFNFGLYRSSPLTLHIVNSKLNPLNNSATVKAMLMRCSTRYFLDIMKPETSLRSSQGFALEPIPNHTYTSHILVGLAYFTSRFNSLQSAPRSGKWVSSSQVTK